MFMNRFVDRIVRRYFKTQDMRTLILLVVIIFNIKSYSQSDTLTNDILTTQVYRKGVYRTFDEFRTNSPSIVTKYQIDERSGSKQYWLFKDNKKVKLLNEVTGKFEIEEDNIWGYSDGENIYVLYALDYESSLNFNKLIVRGKYCVFMYEGYGNAATYYLLRMKMYMTKEFFFDIKDGEFKKFNNRNFEKILKNNSALYQGFINEESKKVVRYQYLKSLNSFYKK